MNNRTLTTAVRLKELVDTKERLWAAMEDVGGRGQEGKARSLAVDTKTLDIGHTKSPQALSAHPEWNTNGDAADIVDDMYVEIFRRLAEHLGLLRCVCRRWQKLVDSPFWRLWPNVGIRAIAYGSPVEPKKKCRIGPGNALSLDEVGDETLLRRGSDKAVLMKDVGAGSGNSEFRRILEIRAKVPALVPHITLRHLYRQEFNIKATFDRHQLQADEALIWQVTKLHKRWPYSSSYAADALTRGANHFDHGQHVPLETVDPTLLEKAKLYDHQRHAAAWLKRTEEKVVKDAPLATSGFYLRTSLHAGCGALGKDLLRGGWPSDKPRPSFDIVARGVIVGCEVSVGKTHQVAAFLLGCQQHVPGDCVPEAEPGKIKYTCALDFGNSPEKASLKDTLFRGLIVTQAALVVVPNTVMANWAQVLRALRPNARIIQLSNKRDHEQCTYEDIVMAHVVLVSRQFLASGSYYREFCNGGRVGEAFFLGTSDGSFPSKGVGRGRQVDFGAQYERFTRALVSDPDFVQARMHRPLLHLFAWPRLVVDELHEIYTPYVTIPEVEFVSARFVVGISATMRGKMGNTQPTSVAEELWTKFLGLGVRVNDFGLLADALHEADAQQGSRGCSRGYKKGQMPQRRHYGAETRAGVARLTGLLAGVPRLRKDEPDKQAFQRSKDIARLNALISDTAVRAIYWRNTQAGVERECPIAEAVIVKVPVPVHPLQGAYAQLLRWSTSRAADVPILMPLVPTHSDHNVPSEPKNFATAPLAGADLGEYPRYFVTMVAAFLEEARAEAKKLRDSAEAYAHSIAYVEELEKAKLRTKAATIEEHLATLSNFSDIVLDHFAPRIARSVYADEVERLYGTKVSLLFRYLDAIDERYPSARSIVAVGYVKALATVFEHLHLKVRNRPYATIGGKNLAATNRELARFNSGAARVLLLNTNTAASGMNLQVATYLFHLDERTPRATRVQFNGRAARSQRKNKVVVFEFYTGEEPLYSPSSLGSVDDFPRVEEEDEEEDEDDPMQIDLVSESDSA
jgi:hypothetical protein